MKSSDSIRGRLIVLICLIGLLYVGLTLAHYEKVMGAQAEDACKLGLIICLCGIWFHSGREYFRFTRTTPVFLITMGFLILFHIQELTEELAFCESVPLFGKTTFIKRAFETALLIGIVCFFLMGNYLSVSAINKARKQLELNIADLREREERYRILFEGANDAIFIMEGERFVDCNSKTLAMFGCTKEQIIGQSPVRFSPATQPDGTASVSKVRSKIEAVQAGTPQCFEWKHLRLDGTPFDAEVSLNLVHWPTGMHIQAIVRDISERKQAVKLLAESEERYRQLTERINEWVWEVDQHGIYTYASPKVEALLGYRPDEVIGKSPLDFMPPDEADRVSQEFNRYRQQKAAFDRLENINIKKDGQRIVLETSGSPIFDQDGKLVGYLGTDRDITDRKQAEQASQESEGRLRQLIDNSPYGALEYELHADGRLLFVGYNRAANRILKTDCHQFMGKTIEQAFPPLAQTPIPSAYRLVAETGKPYDDEQVIYTDDRISGTYEIAAFQTGPGRMAVLFRDITERRRAEDKIKTYQNRLRALVSQLTLSEERERKNLAVELHDGICQSLAMAKLKVDAEMNNPSVAAVQTLLKDLQQAILDVMQDARALINNLGTPMLQQLGLAAALAEWMDSEISAKHGIKTEVVDKGIPARLSEDTKSLLFRAIRELAINVVKHAQAQTLSVALETQAGELSMSIVDDGKGFEHTERMDQDFRHRGYGLFSIHERITYIGGSMAVQSAPGQGTRILIRVPLEGNNTIPS
jgi:PAS domain S-box-containing protein